MAKTGNNKKRSLIVSISIFSILFFLFMVVILSFATYRIYSTTMYDKYQKQMASIVTYIEQHIDNDDMAECATTYVESEKYKEFQKFLDNFIDYYDDVHYIYIMQVLDEDEPVGVRVICTGNSTYEKENEPDMVLHLGDGEEGWYDKETCSRFRSILKGTEDVYYTNASEWGIDYTLVRPLLTSSGEHYGLLCADVSIDEINSGIYKNIYTHIIAIVALAIVFLIVLEIWLYHVIVKPLKQLEKNVVDYADSSTGKKDPDQLVFVEPEFKSNNEIKSLSHSVEKLSENMRDYVKGLLNAEKENKGLQEHVTEMSAIAYRDALTKVSNRAAYDNKIEELTKLIEDKKAEFGIVMVDINDLKYINDNHGHYRGNEYIKGSCNVLTDTYKNSPVYRIGGDEFIVILEGEEYANRESLLNEVREKYFECAINKEVDPWQQYSASVGMSVFSEGDSIEDVSIRADKDMYDMKAKIKSNDAIIHRFD